MMTAQRRQSSSAGGLFTCILFLSSLHINAFLRAPSLGSRLTARPLILTHQRLLVLLFAKKKDRKGPKETKTFGFGGKATEPCPCGSGIGYMKCCGKLHKDPQAFADATAEQVVRARYSAYAKREASGVEIRFLSFRLILLMI